MAKETNKTRTESQTPKKAKQAKNNGGKAGQGRKLNQWRQDRMRAAIEEYIIEDGGVPQLRLLARAWTVPKSTLQHRVKVTSIIRLEERHSFMRRIKQNWRR
ncbi:hypothetical protein CgunFtcFv8_018817 [Champsocephalus gunnari]|uniref:Uncharacterized protein n=1 Tax=Champsocephalus gunnari TaxID=52237 RepID=A0AAN8BUN4_CHAGU|nr:hypothetical protein CgunFtcFv8_018817 [Champsocephalus gunnari]